MANKTVGSLVFLAVGAILLFAFFPMMQETVGDVTDYFMEANTTSEWQEQSYDYDGSIAVDMDNIFLWEAADNAVWESVGFEVGSIDLNNFVVKTDISESINCSIDFKLYEESKEAEAVYQPLNDGEQEFDISPINSVDTYKIKYRLSADSSSGSCGVYYHSVTGENTSTSAGLLDIVPLFAIIGFVAFMALWVSGVSG